MRYIWILALLLFAAPAQAEKPVKPIIERTTLSNGMQVVAVVNRSVPAVMHMVWVRAGSADEPLGKGGMAHFLEHWLFKGTKAYPKGAYSRAVDRVGGESNAFTSKDYTAYFARIPKDFLPELMKMEADRLKNLPFDLTPFEAERKVILEERKSRVDADVYGSIYEVMDGLMFRHHPYRLPVIGYAHEIAALTPEDVRQFYEEHYSAANMILVVGGDIEPAKLFQLAEQHYGSLRAGKPRVHQHVQDPPFQGRWQVELTHPLARQPLWVRRYPAPSFGTAGDAAWKVDGLRLLAYVLGAEPHGFLVQELVRKQKLATAVAVNYDGLSIGPAELEVMVEPTPGTSHEQVEQAVEDALQRFLRQPIQKEALEQAQESMIAHDIYGYEGIAGLPFRLGFALAIGQPPEVVLDVASRLKAVTVERLTEVARDVITPDHHATVTMLPPAKEGKK